MVEVQDLLTIQCVQTAGYLESVIELKTDFWLQLPHATCKCMKLACWPVVVAGGNSNTHQT